MKKLLNKKGFTLIELIVVIAILAILAAILIPSLTNYIGKATQAKDSANARAEYTEFALIVATSTAADLTALDPANAACSATVTAAGEITAFSCTYASGTYAAPTFAKQ